MVIALVVVACALAIVSAIGARLIEARYPPRGVFVEVTGGSLHVLERLSRDPAPRHTILLLHGASGNLSEIDLALGERLSAHHRVILVDRPGHGWSDRPGGAADASPARQARLIRAALDRMGTGKVVVVGHSLAGAVATNLALDHADKVSGLVLLSGVTHPWPGGVAWQNTAVSMPVAGPLVARTIVYPLGTLVMERGIAAVFRPTAPPSGYAERAAIPLLLRPSQFRANGQDISGLKAFVTGQAPRYGAITVPTTVITADQDHVVSPMIHSMTIARQIEGAELVVIPRAGHMIHHTATDRVVEEIERLAARVGP